MAEKDVEWHDLNHKSEKHFEYFLVYSNMMLAYVRKKFTLVNQANFVLTGIQ